jgi:hypothetical protein
MARRLAGQGSTRSLIAADSMVTATAAATQLTAATGHSA